MVYAGKSSSSNLSSSSWPASWPMSPPCRGPPARQRRGPGVGVRNTIYRRERRLVVSAPATGDGGRYEDRVCVTGDHLTFDGNLYGVHPAASGRPGGRSNGARPSLSSDPSSPTRTVRRCTSPTHNPYRPLHVQRTRPTRRSPTSAPPSHAPDGEGPASTSSLICSRPGKH